MAKASLVFGNPRINGVRVRYEKNARQFELAAQQDRARAVASLKNRFGDIDAWNEPGREALIELMRFVQSTIRLPAVITRQLDTLKNWVEIAQQFACPTDLPEAICTKIQTLLQEAAKAHTQEIEAGLRIFFPRYDQYPKVAKAALLDIGLREFVAQMPGSFIRFVNDENWYMSGRRTLDAEQEWSQTIAQQFFTAYEAARRSG